FRVAIRDGTSGKVGSVGQFIEVPNLKKKRLTVSAIILENNSIEQWRNISGDKGLTSAGASTTAAAADPLIDTALRRFRKSTVLRYGYEVYNARLEKTNAPNLTARVRIFRDGKLIYEGRDNPLIMTGQNDTERVKASGAISLGEALKPGDYILQVAVTDRSGKERSNIATQFIQFEVTD
ncbi:MAG: hypothetical protein ABI539_06575, partial [Acidobacteriota bacterium]